jgi:uncharacterized protein (DUF488 family)
MRHKRTNELDLITPIGSTFSTGRGLTKPLHSTRVKDTTRQGDPMGTLFTVGHSNHEPEQFIRLLQRHEIDLLIDVRSRPYSRYVPHFNKGSIGKVLLSNGVRYMYGGKFLGGMGGLSIDDSTFLEKMGKVTQLATQQNVAMMCSEGKPFECHRFYKLGAFVMRDTGELVHHINRDSSLTLQDEFEENVGEAALWHELGEACTAT